MCYSNCKNRKVIEQNWQKRKQISRRRFRQQNHYVDTKIHKPQHKQTERSWANEKSKTKRKKNNDNKDTHQQERQ